MRLHKAIATLAVLPLLVAASGCKHDSKSAWADVAKNCAYSDLNENKLLFFGASNSIGPGSIWRLVPDGGGYRLRWDSNKVPGDWIKPGQEFDCQGSESTKLTGGATVDFASGIAPLSASLKSELSKAKSVEVKVSKLKTILIEEGEFEQAIIALPQSSPLKQDLTRPGRLIMYQAVLVSGLEAKLVFDTAVGAEVGAKLKDGVVQSINGDLGAGLNVKWISKNELVLSSQNPFYIAGELAKFDTGGGFASANKSQSWETVEIQEKHSIGVETN
ncbi:hypothetical protein [Pseudomonas sp. NFX98]|uniref:hypothetical protein n=1 Tax=Pseudomonas sp. NFX98 TaxID=3399122 RepID=UPI0039FBD07A